MSARSGAATIDPAQLWRLDAEAFIRTNLPLVPVPSIPEISLHIAQPSSGLWRLLGHGDASAHSPYWAYPWAGGAALARHFLAHPEVVRGSSVLDLGAGSGLVAIAAVQAGAASVIAADVDPFAVVATKLNAAANSVNVSAVQDDLTNGPPPAVDVIAVGDLFYDRELALRVTDFLDRCLASGIEILIGDPGRAFLPRPRLRPIAEYAVADFANAGATKPAGVFSFTR
jgi:predicted nicotinamide N-methyase